MKEHIFQIVLSIFIYDQLYNPYIPECNFIAKCLFSWLLNMMMSCWICSYIFWWFRCMCYLCSLRRIISISFHWCTAYKFCIDIWRLLKIPELKEKKINIIRSIKIYSFVDFIPLIQCNLLNQHLNLMNSMLVCAEQLASHLLSL